MMLAGAGNNGNRKKGRTAVMDSQTGTILSTLLKKRLKTLGYPSLRKFHADRPGLGLSYEVLRQVVYGGHIPRPETLFRILGSMQFSSSQVRKICGMHYGDYLPISSPVTDAPLPSPARTDAGIPESSADPGATYPAERSRQENEPSSTPPEEPGEILSRLRASLQRIPVPGNEDIWEMVEALARIAEQKVRRSAGRQAEQPLLFAGEPEAIYQFLVRKNRISPFLSRGENLPFDFVDGIDYRDRFRGALLGSAVGEALGGLTQGLTSRDVEELFGELDALPVIASARRAAAPRDSLLLSVAGSLLPDGVLAPEKTADAIARTGRRDEPPGLAGFARNLLDRGLPWHEAGENAPESMPAVLVLPIALLRAGNFRRLKLEAGILVSLTHIHPTAIAGGIAQACAVARILHTPASTLDAISFSRALSPVVAGIEPERGARPRIGRSVTSVGRKLGAELPALLLRRASVQEMQEALGNGTAAHEGIPFSLGCFLRSPGDFAEAVMPAVRHGGDASAIAAMAGALCGAYLGESGIPERFLAHLPGRRALGEAAEGLLALARRDG
jgi:ADP-ribosylglycohydrolase